MADVNNTIGLDASQAIGELGRLDTALDIVQQSITQLNVTASGTIATPFDQIGKSAKKAGDEGVAASQRIGKGVKGAGEEVRRFGLRFQDVLRIVQSQIIFGIISEIRQGFFEAADAAAEFQLQLARIEAIELDGFKDVRAQVEALAVTLGRPFDEVGEAVFEALQNDLGDVSETFKILEKDGKNLALLTGGTLPQAVNALSSIYKSFNKETEDLTNVSGQLFGTINAGRITLADLESSLGTLSPLGKQAGVGLQDILDALATITLTGTKASVATTQLRNVFNKAIKPTEALSKVYSDLGVRGFGDLVKREDGLVGALKAITGAVDNDQQAVARLFNTIRANLGVLNTLTNNGKLFAETSNRSAEAAGRLAEAIQKIEDTPARKAAVQAAKLETIFTQIGDTSQAVQIQVAEAFLQFVDSGDDALVALGLITSSLAAATVATVSFGASIAAVAAGGGALLGSFVAVTTILKVLSSFQAEAAELGDTLDSFNANSLKEVADTVERINAEEIEKTNAAFQNTESILNQVASAAKETGDELNGAFNVDTANINAVTQGFLDRFSDGRKRVIEDIGSTIDNIDQSIKDSLREIEDAQQDLSDFTFEEGLRNLNDFQKLAARSQRSADLIAKAFEAASNVGLSKESQETAKAASDAAVAAAKAELTAAKRLGSEIEIQKAVTKVQEAITSRIAAQRQLNREQSVSEKQLRDEEQALKQLNAEQRRNLETVIKTNRERITEATSRGEDAPFIEGLREQARKELEGALEGLDEFTTQRIVKAFGASELSSALNKTVSEGLRGTELDFNNAVDQLRSDLANADDLVAAVELIGTLNVESLSTEIQRAIALATRGGGTAADDLVNTAKAVKGIADEQLGIQNQIEQSSAQAKADAAEAIAFLRESSSLGFEAGKGSILGASRASSIAGPAINELEQIGSKSEEELVKLQTGFLNALEFVREEVSTGLFGDVSEARQQELTKGLTAGLGAVTEQLEVIRSQSIFRPQTLEEANGLLDKLIQVSEDGVVVDVDGEPIREANRLLDLTEQKGREAGTGIGSITGASRIAEEQVLSLSSTTGGLAQQANAASQAFKQLLRDIQAAIQAAASAPTGPPSFHGGMQYMASGGTLSRGQDTMLTPTSPGEFVTNSRATRNFLPELQSINSGNAIRPDSGGGDTNVTIGDVIVNSNSQLPSQQARDLSTSIKREIRKGTIRL